MEQYSFPSKYQEIKKLSELKAVHFCSWREVFFFTVLLFVRFYTLHLNYGAVFVIQSLKK